MNKERIKKALENTLVLKGGEYINSLVNTDGRRWSTKIKDVEDLLALDWEEISQPLDWEEQEIVCCFRATTKSALGLGFSDLMDLRECEFPVDFHEGQLIGSQQGKKKTREAHLMLGSCQGKEIILTAFPGCLFYDVRKFPGKSIKELRELNLPFAVKPYAGNWIEFQAQKQGVDLKDSVLLLGESFSEETDLENINYGNILNWRDEDLLNEIEDQIEKSWRSFLRDLRKDRLYVLVRTEERVFDLVTQISLELLNRVSVLNISCEYEERVIQNQRIRAEERGRAVSFRNYKD